MADPGTSSTVPCPICGMPYKQRGLNKHMASCKLKKTNRAKDTEFLAKEKLRAAQEILKARNRNQASSTSQIPSLPPAVPAPNESLAFRPLGSPPSVPSYPPSPPPLDLHNTGVDSDSSRESTPGPSPVSEGDQIQPQIDDIKCNYHPSSQRPTTVHHFHEYGLNSKAQPDYIIDDEPWRPFRTRRDFEFASIALTQSLNENAVDTLLELTYGAVGRDPSRGALTLQSYKEMMNIWKLAANKMPGVCSY